MIWDNTVEPYVYMIVRPVPGAEIADRYVGSTLRLSNAMYRHRRDGLDREAKIQYALGDSFIMVPTETIRVARCAELFLYWSLDVPLNLRAPPNLSGFNDVAVPFLHDYATQPLSEFEGTRIHQQRWRAMIVRAFRRAGFEPPATN